MFDHSCRYSFVYWGLFILGVSACSEDAGSGLPDASPQAGLTGGTTFSSGGEENFSSGGTQTGSGGLANTGGSTATGTGGATVVVPVDCSGITAAGYEICETSESSCAAVYTDGSGCAAVCAAAGFECEMAHEDVDGQCAANKELPALPCDSGHISDYCVCSGVAAGSGGTSGTGGNAGTGGSTPMDPPNLFALSTDVVEVWVNGTSVGQSTSPGSLFSVAADFIAGQENIIAIRASKGSSGTPFVLAELDGVFGKAGTSVHWKAKAASSSDELTGSNWTANAFNDASWGAARDVSVAPSEAEFADGPARGIWTSSSSDGTALLRMHFYIPANWSVDVPMGLGAGVTGGAGGPVVKVSTPSQLAAAVVAPGAATIEVSGTIDFRGLEGKTTVSVCYQSQCANGQFEYITNGLGACDSAGNSTFNYSYDTAGVKPLLVTSNKTIIGVGPNATIVGKGMKLVSGVTNVIIRNLTITNINPELIWGGDAIDLSGASNVWIDHNRVSLVGRQFLVSHYDPNQNVTVSFNDFDGNTPNSSSCNGTHYWDMLLLGAGDTITLANNYMHMMSGRSPHAGGYDTANVSVHMVNDYHKDILGHAADTGVGGKLFYEGSVFENVTTPFTTNTEGHAYAPLPTTLSSTNAACNATLGRACVANTTTSSPGSFRLDSPALTTFSSLSAKMVTPYPADQVKNCVLHLAGPGHI